MRRVAVVGNLSLDSVDGSQLRIGGGSYYAAQALALIGAPAVVVARCAGADRSQLTARLDAVGVPARVLDGRATARFALRYVGDRREVAVEEIGDTWSLEDAKEIAAELEDCEWLHVAPLLRSDFPPETLVELARGRTLSLDGQGLVRPAATGPLRLDRDFDPALLRAVSILKLAEDEAGALFGEVDEGAIRELEVDEVVVTLGARGSLVFAGGSVERIRARPIRGVDQTGAGDAFAAAYLASRARGLSPVIAADTATALVEQLLERRRAQATKRT